MTYEQALQNIHSLDAFGAKLGTDRLSKLLSKIGNPQKKLKYIHTAGTNGKGSVCVMLSNILKKSGYKTGLYISPFVCDFRERIQINNKMIDGDFLAEAIDIIMPIVRKMAENDEIITEFELVTAAAFYCFEKEKCDIVVLETGLGGRYDATNVIDCPLCSVITPIGLDHTAILGDTLTKIAFEKAGIIKQNSNTVISRQKNEAKNELLRCAKERNNNIFFADDVTLSDVRTDISGNSFVYKNEKITLNLLGKHQIDNVKTVLRTVEVLNEYSGFLNIPLTAVKSALSGVSHPARLELLRKEPVILLDGAHNPDGIETLSDFVKSNLSDKKIVCIMGMLRDKDSISSIEILNGLFNTVITVPIQNPRSMTEKELADVCRGHFENVEEKSDVKSAVDEALSLADGEENAIVICGSLYLAGEIRQVVIDKL
ncbi:MAG: bifunctional folylpolyglutamate synthase/dihydrofolate synthase [Acutalibacteraceae bacterium]